jgi:hypothetical protein
MGTRGRLTEATDYRPTNAGTIWTLLRDVTNETMKTRPTNQSRDPAVGSTRL